MTPNPLELIVRYIYECRKNEIKCVNMRQLSTFKMVVSSVQHAETIDNESFVCISRFMFASQMSCIHTGLTLTWQSQFMGWSKVSEPPWHVCYGFKCITFVLNAHADVAGRKSKASHTSCSRHDSLLPRCCIRSICFLYTVSFNNYWSSISHARSIQKAFTFYFTTLCTTQQTAPHVLSEEIITPVGAAQCMARQAASHVPLTRHIMGVLSYL